jgi:Anti-sigma-28 factor, FlgM
MPIFRLAGRVGGTLSTVNAGLDELAERIARGEYVVDAEAVAEAMMRRWREPSVVLVAAQALDGPAIGADEDEPAAGGDLA